MAVAAAEKGEKDRHVVAIIGDGSMSGGLAFEGLNNASSTPNSLLIILNDNDMSIDKCRRHEAVPFQPDYQQPL